MFDKHENFLSALIDNQNFDALSGSGDVIDRDEMRRSDVKQPQRSALQILQQKQIFETLNLKEKLGHNSTGHSFNNTIGYPVLGKANYYSSQTVEIFEEDDQEAMQPINVDHEVKKLKSPWLYKVYNQTSDPSPI